MKVKSSLSVAAFTVNWYQNYPPKDKPYGNWLFGLNQSYVTMAVETGWFPVAILPCIRNNLKEFLKGIDLVVLTGGGDIDPSIQKSLHNTDNGTYNNRALWEIEIFRCALETGTPVLGICLGFQLIAIAEGARFIQDIALSRPDALDHHGTPSNPRNHPVRFEKGTETASALKEIDSVSSFHHQGIDRLPETLTLVATAPDGIVEAFEDRRRKIYAVQWHPERDATGKLLMKYLQQKTRKGSNLRENVISGRTTES
jgi:putative glutamine amidotransferase